MDVERDALVEEGGQNEHELVPLSVCEMCQLFAFSFGNGVLISSYFIVTLPIESALIDHERRAVVLGGFVAVAGLTQLICPIVGLYSDRCQHPWGKRRPFIGYGGIAGVLGLLMQWYCRTEGFWWLYLFAFTASMVALNVIYSSMNGLIADFIPQEQTGRANGVIAMLSVFGAVSSFAVFQMLANNMGLFYLFYTATIAITTSVTFNAADRKTVTQGYSSNLSDVDRFESSKINEVTISDIKNAFWIDPIEHHDFFIILISRTLYYMGVSSQTFLMYYLRDKLSMKEHDAESYTAVLAVAGQFCGVMTAFPAGYLSDKLGNGRKFFIFASCFVLAVCNLALIGAETQNAVFWITCILGMGNGVYLTSDASLAIDALPNKEEAARFMGIWGVGAFVGSALGPLLGGPVLSFSSHSADATTGGNNLVYGTGGYAALLGASALYFAGSAYVLRWVHAA